jgi:hypothetical protein
MIEIDPQDGTGGSKRGAGKRKRLTVIGLGRLTRDKRTTSVSAPVQAWPKSEFLAVESSELKAWLLVDQGGSVKFERVDARDWPRARQRPVFFEKNAAVSERKFDAAGS